MDSVMKVGDAQLSDVSATRGKGTGAASGTPSLFGRAFTDALKEATWRTSSAQPTGKVGAAAAGEDSRATPLQGQRPAGESSLHERALALLSYRQELIAANIANADTRYTELQGG